VKRAFLALTGACMIAVTLSAWMVAEHVNRLLSDADAVAVQTSVAMPQMVKDEHDTALKLQKQLDAIGEVTAQAKAVLVSINQQEMAQSRKIDQTAKNLVQASNDLRTFIAFTDKNLNSKGGTLPQLNTLIADINDTVPPAIASINKSATDADVLLTDPQLKAILQHSADTLADVHKMADDAAITVHEHTRPMTKKQKVIAGAKDIGALTYILLKVIFLL
jgi:hypothetical protein